MKKTIKMLGAVFLGAGIAAGAVAAEAPELTPADKGIVSVMRDYNACVGARMWGMVDAEGSLDPKKIPADLLQNLVQKIRATIADLKSKDPEMPELVFNMILGLEASGITQRWAKDGCDTELKPDWPAINKRMNEINEQRDTPYGQKFFKELSVPEP